jgi:quinol monooxygenase YgiN
MIGAFRHTDETRSGARENEMSKSTRRGFLGAGAAVAGAAAIEAIGFNRMASAQESDAMITQTAALRLNPEKEAEAVALLQELTAAVEEKEPGVLVYIAHRHAAETDVVEFFEVYDGPETLAAHGQQPHLAKLRDGFMAGIFRPFSAEAPVKIVRLNRVAGFAR